LVAKLADKLGLDRQELLILPIARSEAKALIAATKPTPPKNTAPLWQRFIRNHEMLARYQVSDRELRAPENLSLLGTKHSAKEFLAILTLIGDIPVIR
jgi:hypothetical protein